MSPVDTLAISGVAPAAHDARRAARVRRLVAAVVAVSCAAVLTAASWLTPSPSGLGTHEQLGMPACGWIILGDLPCPTCGMTTAFAHAADGHLLASLKAQPLGCALAIACAMALLVSGHVMLTGSRLGSVFVRLWGRRAAWTLALLVLGAWGYKVASYKGWL